MSWMSMTGYGRGEAHGETVSVAAEIRSVNHRFLDVHLRCPSKYLAWEPRVRGMVRDALRRGKVDVFLGVKEWGRTGAAVRVNRELLAAVVAEAEKIREETGLPSGLGFRDLFAIPDLVVFAAEGAEPAEANWPLAERAVRGALGMLAASRRDEGGRLREVVRATVADIGRIAGEIAALSSENKELAAARFRERIAALAGEAGTDPARIHQEAAYLLDRLDVTEECDRLASHLRGLSALLSGEGEAVGKRFDFLLQEVFREFNTAANKSAHAGISERVVAAKTELEKVREQIQNVE